MCLFLLLIIYSCAVSNKTKNAEIINDQIPIENYFACHRFRSCNTYMAFLISIFDCNNTIETSRSSQKNSTLIYYDLKGFSSSMRSTFCAKNQNQWQKIIICDSCLNEEIYFFLENTLNRNDYQKLKSAISEASIYHLTLGGILGFTIVFKKDNWLTILM